MRSGNSGGPVVDGDGRVLTTVFATSTSGDETGFGVPDTIVRKALDRAARSRRHRTVRALSGRLGDD